MTKTAIYLEDDSASRNMMSQVFELFMPEFDLTLYENGNDYKTTLNTQADLIILDINLGLGADGHTIMYWLREQETSAVLVALTAEAHQAERLGSTGFDAVIIKPLSEMQQCADLLRRALDGEHFIHYPSR